MKVTSNRIIKKNVKFTGKMNENDQDIKNRFAVTLCLIIIQLQKNHYNFIKKVSLVRVDFEYNCQYILKNILII